MAILVNMLPREYQDVAMQFSCGKKLKYEEMRDHILGIAKQKVQMAKPVPMDVGSLENPEGKSSGGNEDWGGQEAGGDCGLDAVSQNVQCYACGGYGHLARDCIWDKKEDWVWGSFKMANMAKFFQRER